MKITRNHDGDILLIKGDKRKLIKDGTIEHEAFLSILDGDVVVVPKFMFEQYVRALKRVQELEPNIWIAAQEKG